MLEFNPPVHGTWNIVHIGMALPEAHQIYVCADNCMRGVIMTALEMGAGDRFSCVTLTEQDFYHDNLEEITIEGVSEVLNELEKIPPVILLFTVCVHKFTGCDLDYVYKELARRFPDTHFVRCYMDPISQKEGPTPEEKLRLAMFDPVPDLPKEEKTVCILGCDVSQKAGTSDLMDVLLARGCTVRQLQDCGAFSDYERLGEGALFICSHLTGKAGVKHLAERLSRPYVFLPDPFESGAIRTEVEKLLRELRRMDVGKPDAEQVSVLMQKKEEEAQAALLHLKTVLQDTPVALDYTAVTRPVALASLLLSYGISVRALFLDAVLPEEEELLLNLTTKYPKLSVYPTIRPNLRSRVVREKIRLEAGGEKVLAIGQKAAWILDTPYFVNMIEGNGYWGFGGIGALSRDMEEAFANEKDLHDLVPKKGLGCACVIG